MQIKFITINVWFGGKVWDNLISYIKSEKPDILALQEVYDSHNTHLDKRYRSMDEYKKEFSDFLPFSAFGATIFDTGVDALWGNAVFSKFPIKKSETVFFDLPFSEYNFTIDPDPRFASEGMLGAELDIDGRNAFVYSWHGVWDNHGSDSPNRDIMGNEIIKALKSRQNIILAGDTNVHTDTQVIKRIESELELQNVFGNSLISTFNMKQKTKPLYAKESVDKIFLSSEFKVLEKEMPEVDVSDHYPLKVLLEF